MRLNASISAYSGSFHLGSFCDVRVMRATAGMISARSSSVSSPGATLLKSLEIIRNFSKKRWLASRALASDRSSALPTATTSVLVESG